jgi:hypothetical protein
MQGTADLGKGKTRRGIKSGNCFSYSLAAHSLAFPSGFFLAFVPFVSFCSSSLILQIRDKSFLPCA